MQSYPSTKNKNIYLDSISPAFYEIGYGGLGVGGDLGYEQKAVVVHGKHYAHALSTHPPARVHFRLAGEYTAFECSVALNDDVSRGASRANFSVLVDGVEIAHAADVQSGEPRAPCTSRYPGQNLWI